MTLVFVFALTLLLAVLLSELSDRSVLSAAALFLVAGFVVGDGVLKIVSIRADDPVVSRLAELALFSVLFTEGMRVSSRELRAAWRLPGRALVLGMPLTCGMGALLAHWLIGLDWARAFLVAAVLSPTDPVFAAAIVGREEIPARLRHLLNVESGLNDGLALPLVLGLLAVVGRGEIRMSALIGELALGVVVGVVLPIVILFIEKQRFFSITRHYRALFVFAIGLLVLSVCWLIQANEFLAAFAAGATMASVRPERVEQFERFGAQIAELLKLSAVLVFACLISREFLAEIPWTGYAFALLALILIRPAAIGLSLFGSDLPLPEKAAAAWFGPKGFASVVYGLMVLEADMAMGHQLFHLIALVVVGSILSHSSTDVMIARYFRRAESDADAAQVGNDSSSMTPEKSTSEVGN